MQKDSIKLKYSFLDNKLVHQAVRSLAVQPLKGHVAYNVNKIIDALDGAIKTWKTKYDLFVANNAVKNEDGTYKAKMGKNSNGEEINQGVLVVDEEKADKEFQVIYNEEFTLNVNKIYLEDILDVKLSADHLRALAPLIIQND